ncbi:hephaestin-like protein [Dendronephthya gigantea]|uniref:hephaestin-like protein n=1 Tax=Dendronephthya gigantea TaxID=151771 RepID=UPI00106AC142|nr:hephaestin-like protein [Dendronephthya gigantea]
MERHKKTIYFCIILALLGNVNCVLRTYYIAAVEEKWNYAPTGVNQLTGVLLDEDEAASVFTVNDPTKTIGREYNKVLYRGCTSRSCSKFKDHPPYLGVLGPVIRAEVGDIIKVYFKNLASRNYSIHPHGVFYQKNSEGALYEDGTRGRDKSDDAVPPNASYTYTWKVRKEHGPTASDSDCLTWVYHSHVHPQKDVNTGLVGAMLICKKGTFKHNKHKNIDKDFVIMFTVMDENESWLLERNIAEYCPQFSSSIDDEDFQESNKMHVINGYFYGNTPGLKMCTGDKVDWHLFGMGTEVDIHTAFFHGQTVQIDGHRKDVGSMFPARSSTAHMTAIKPGVWLFNCLVNDHYSAGMSALFNVTNCEKNYPGREALSGKTRKYFIAAEEVIWDYAPSGMDNFNGGNLTSEDSKGHEFFAKSDSSIGGRYWKALFFEYTNDRFIERKEKPNHLGFLGPIIRAEVGDTIQVTFKNMASYNFSIQPHGVIYDKSNEGSMYKDGTSNSAKRDDSVRPNDVFVYTWTIPKHVGPTKDDPNCLTWVYSSAVDPIKDVYSGLIGPLLVCKKGSLDAEGKQKSISKEFFLMFTVSNENEAWYIEKNVNEFIGGEAAKSFAYDPEIENNLMHGINGFLFANLPGLEMCLNDDVSWHLIGYGNEVDIHGAYFHGQTFLMNKNRKDAVNLIPGTFETVKMKPDNPGEWAVVCRTNDHYDAGMVAKFRVNTCNKVPSYSESRKTRTYYISAIEEKWDYGPSGKNEIEGTDLDKDKDAMEYAKSGQTRIGRVYHKALYREYTDDTFTTRKESPEYLGFLGPILRAEVGESIRVVFKNQASRKFSVHPHGVFYDKENEGALYIDDTTLKDDDAVLPGQTYIYTWKVPARAGPTSSDNDCLSWMYYSHVEPSKDTNSGLVGPLIICRKGTLSEDGSRAKNADHEYPVYFSVVDENLSWYLDKNIEEFTNDPVDKEDEDFIESNKMNGINGRIYGNLDGLEMVKGQNIFWYLLSLGTEVDMHNVHFHGQTVLARTTAEHREDVVDLFPGVFMTVKMIPDSIGKWLLHCHVNDHMVHGMQVFYDVKEKRDK